MRLSRVHSDIAYYASIGIPISAAAEHAHATDRYAHEIRAILTLLPALAAADAQSVGRLFALPETDVEM
jgi:hypothetical protein